jgi:hypothetical protein
VRFGVLMHFGAIVRFGAIMRVAALVFFGATVRSEPSCFRRARARRRMAI